MVKYGECNGLSIGSIHCTENGQTNMQKLRNAKQTDTELPKMTQYNHTYRRQPSSVMKMESAGAQGSS